MNSKQKNSAALCLGTNAICFVCQGLWMSYKASNSLITLITSLYHGDLPAYLSLQPTSKRLLLKPSSSYLHCSIIPHIDLSTWIILGNFGLWSFLNHPWKLTFIRLTRITRSECNHLCDDSSFLLLFFNSILLPLSWNNSGQLSLSSGHSLTRTNEDNMSMCLSNIVYW